MNDATPQLVTRIGTYALVFSLAVLVVAIAGCGSEIALPSSVERTPMQNVSIDGINISYLEKGEGDPVVLVHGIPTSSYLWRDMIGELSAHGRVIAPDLPGFGYSDPPPNGDYSISRYAAVFETFLETLSIERATLVCHDWGGPIVLTYALRHPDKYERLIIFDTFLHRDDLPPWPLSMKIAKIRPFGEIFMGLGGRSIARAGLEQGVRDTSLITDGIVQRYYMPDGDPDKLKRTMLGTLRVEYLEDLRFIEQNIRTIDRPTLVVWAEDDSFFPVSVGDRIHSQIKGSSLVRIPDCGHFIPEERPITATQIIIDFLKTSQYADGEI
jgi:pimeloyl-ACP methyl ester carboxylesterase